MQAWRDRVDDTLPGILRRSTLPIARGRKIPTYRIDTYDIWAQGWPIHTAIPAYDQARESAYGYSTALPTYMFYVFYSGVYGRGLNRPRPLAAFLAGEQLPLPIRLTPSNDIDQMRQEYPPLDHRRSLRVFPWGDRCLIYRYSTGSWPGGIGPP